jgi:murein DD-endopeptidase MepM/ murein hydrolase activator NlpD
VCCEGRATASVGDRDLDHGKLRGSHALRAGPEPIDLGDEPPLSADGARPGLLARRRVSVQWFSGTVLTGLCGAALMGGAVYATLDGEANFAALPERLEAALRGTVSGERLATVIRKSNRLPQAGEINAARQLIRVSTTSRGEGEREVVRVRPFIRVSSNLSLSVTELSANIPLFSPQRVLAEAGRTDEPPGAEPDAEVSFVTRDLAPILPRIKLAALVSSDEVLARIRDVAEWSGSTRPALADIQSGQKLAYAAEGDGDPYAGFEPRIVPENITLLAKTTNQATGGNNWAERTVSVRKGETLATILRDAGAVAEDIKAIAAILGPRGRDGGLREGHKLRILVAPAGPGQRVQPIRVIVLNENTIEAVVALSDAGKYVSVDVQHVGPEVPDPDDDDDNDISAIRLYQSIYETALRNQVPRHVIDDLIRIYSYDVDFQRKVQPGDSFEVFFGAEDESGREAKSDVLFAALTVNGEKRRYYRFQTPDDSVVDYYDEAGRSAKKFLVRKPVLTAIMRSGFGVRRHPLLGYMKMHTGVDWAAPNGTPIYASGNGTVEKVGWESGYGKYVRLRHTNGYETAYGHMSGFARGIKAGVRVRQGQVIGYVGSTGLSTGPHVHYEIIVNGRFVDPMRIKLPRGRVLDGSVLANFERERDRVDGMMNRAPARAMQTPTSHGG